MLAWYDETAANDRLLFASFVAMILHVAVILGIGFTREQHDPLPQSLEITLAQRSDVASENADFLAQSNQLGSGTETNRLDLGTPLESRFAATAVQPVLAGAEAATAAAAAETEVVQTRNSAQQLTEEEAKPNPAEADAPAIDGAAQPRSSSEIASLMARLAAQQQAYARLPRVQRLTTVSTRAADDAEYLYNWKQRIEIIGNLNYPLEAKRQRLHGDLRLLVALRPDGSVAEIRVLQSSGEQVLDDAAARIVRLAAPFEPFPASLRARVDVLQIIRTWQFRANRLTASE